MTLRKRLDNAFEALERSGFGPVTRDPDAEHISGGMAVLERFRSGDDEYMLKIPYYSYNRFLINESRLHEMMQSICGRRIPELCYSDVSRDVPYIVLEYVCGKTFHEGIRQDELSPERVINCLADIAETLFILHERDILHRDLTPANIMISDDRNVLIDFGLAIDISPGSSDLLHYDGKVCGAVGYIPPEAYFFKKGLAPAYDQYSFGQTIARVIGDGDESSYFSRKGFPESLISIHNRCKRRDPSERYPSCKELAEDLRRLV